MPGPFPLPQCGKTNQRIRFLASVGFGLHNAQKSALCLGLWRGSAAWLFAQKTIVFAGMADGTAMHGKKLSL
jgi:hypothetical protein